MTTTWYETNDATWELTGVQLEVGSQATAFEHRSFGEELQLCQRYYQYVPSGLFNIRGSTSITYSNAPLQTTFLLPMPMRASPTASNKADGGSTITMTYYSNSYGSATNYEASLGIGFDNAIVRYNFVHSSANNSGNGLSTTYYWGETQDSVAFSSEL